MRVVHRLIVALVLTGVTLLIPFAPAVFATDYYRVTVSRIDSNLYRDLTSRNIIVTKYCYEYVYGDDAILVWDGRGSGSNKLIFSSGTTCDVEGVYRR